MAIWTDGKQHEATEDLVKAKFGIIEERRDFHCFLCGYTFKVGDLYRWIYMNDKSPSPGNFFTCNNCDRLNLDEQVRESLKTIPNIPDWALWYRLQKAESD